MVYDVTQLYDKQFASEAYLGSHIRMQNTNDKSYKQVSISSNVVTTAVVDILACKADVDCHKNGFCNSTSLCSCRTGYYGDGKINCTGE